MFSQTGKPATDIATLDHWESVWKKKRSARRVSRWSYYDRRVARLFGSLVGPQSRVLEIGCGGSRWIGFFDREIGCETWGIDYSPEGLRIAEQNNAGRPGVHLVAGDFFDESLLPSDYFDFIFSRGFIEHYTDPTVVTQRIAQILRPGGKVLTLIPNFVGICGRLQKRVDAGIFDKHVVMDCRDLDLPHVTADLEPVMPAQFWGCFAPGVVNYGSKARFLLPPIKLAQQLVCWPLSLMHLDFESRLASPYIVGIYQKPE
jgi:SAM-dependent methyltransferase